MGMNSSGTKAKSGSGPYSVFQKACNTWPITTVFRNKTHKEGEDVGSQDSGLYPFALTSSDIVRIPVEIPFRPGLT